MLAVLASLSPPAGAGGEGRKGRSLGPALSVTLALTFLAGCKLIDQRTFEGAPKAPSAADLAHRDLPPLPLLTVDPSNPDAGWQSQVADAVQAGAEDPGSVFDERAGRRAGGGGGVAVGRHPARPHRHQLPGRPGRPAARGAAVRAVAVAVRPAAAAGAAPAWRRA
jgi:hypothetical protein